MESKDKTITLVPYDGATSETSTMSEWVIRGGGGDQRIFPKASPAPEHSPLPEDRYEEQDVSK